MERDYISDESRDLGRITGLLRKPTTSELQQAFGDDVQSAGLEAVPWAWIATELGKGALSWLGGKLLESLFGSFANASAKMQEVMRAELQGEALRKACALMDSLTIRLGQYHNGGGMDRLELANKDAEDLIAEFKSLWVLGFHSYHQAVGLEILILQDRYKATNNAGEKVNIREAIDRAFAYLPQVEIGLRDATRGRFGDVWYFPLFPGNANSLFQGGHFFDGNRVQTCTDFFPAVVDKARDNEQSAIAAALNDLYLQQIMPSRDIRVNWSHLRSTLG